MRFDLTDLRLFVHVAEAASITRGAARANMALASASARIQGMEQTLGTALLLRGRRGVTLAPAGHALLHHARIVLQQVEHMRGELGAYASGLRGHVRLWCNTAALSEFLPEALAGYLTQHPNVDIDVEERPSYAIAQAVIGGLADIGIVADVTDLTGLETLPFALDRLVVIVPRHHRLARRRQIAFREAARYPFIGLAADNPLQEYINRHASRTGGAPKQRVQMRDFESICRLVARGVGVGIVPQTAARRCDRVLPFATVPFTDAWALRRLTICVRRLDALPTHGQQLVAHLKASAIATMPPSTQGKH
ncbi:LysR family transcriptional regulator [Reyranella sp. CPCC 100927]|uniref:LysR family transcriptional regulator n=1 Tax=Reyranella sp. CPCC 100927 TaxID=2599616 RepID=UPI0011B70B9C|nr:LysR family transcriptional regulator [Reyranella sp. CPCC 100927]TWT05757.1 LysR family transcriptional regulator [Reyranella sp. CPCC 100927]